MNKFLIPAIVIVVIVGGYFYWQKSQNPQRNEQSNQPEQNTNQNQVEEQASKPAEEPVPDKAYAEIETSLGSFKVELDGKSASKTVANFIKLSKQEFYNGLKFHRVIPDFVVQGGDPEGTGMGGPGYTVPAEIGLKHKKGAIAMARTDDSVNPTRASSGSQFYIALDDLPDLDGKYTVFGYVTSGMSVVDKIGAVPTEPGDYPIEDVIIKKITIE